MIERGDGIYWEVFGERGGGEEIMAISMPT